MRRAKVVGRLRRSSWWINLGFLLGATPIAGPRLAYAVEGESPHALFVRALFEPSALGVNYKLFSNRASSKEEPTISDDPILWVMRAQRVLTPNCRAWFKALSSTKLTQGIALGAQNDLKAFDTRVAQSWEPYSTDDEKDFQKCGQFPCKFKLSAEEVRAVAQGSEKGGHRQTLFLQAVRERLKRYLQTQVHPRTDSEEDPPQEVCDPWDLIKTLGLGIAANSVKSSNVYFRKLDFGAGRMRPLRQIIDWQIQTLSSGEALAQSRDIYTDHYFDRWGEMIHLRCAARNATQKMSEVRVTQALIVELDLIKKNDLFSKLGRGKMRSAVEDGGRAHLDQIFKILRRQASEFESVAQ